MFGPVDNGSESLTDEDIVRAPRAEMSTSSGTVAFVPQSNRSSQDESQASAREDDRTVISQRPVAAPEEFYRSMPLSELAGMLEGRQLDHFAVEQMIGGGGMGAVFRGRDLRLDRVVAIKVIPAARRDPETLRRFRLEAQAAAKLDHPNIARVYYVGEAEQWNYIVFEFIDGVNIRDLVEMEGPLSVDDAVFYSRQVAEALQHAYEREVVHRDIKPSNILVTAAGAAKVVDMGLARDASLDKSTADETASGVTLGTFDYISPEQARNPRDADVRSDLYSLGCTLFFMLTGNPPFPEGTALQKLLSHGSQAPPDPRGWREDLSDELFEITMKLMAKRPVDRYQTPTELISDLMMLAEVENLPRSQSPGSMLLPNHSTQPSLVESNLAWIVAVAFLLGSTLWLASVQSLTNDFTIAELEFPTKVSATVALPGTSQSPAREDDTAPLITPPPAELLTPLTNPESSHEPIPSLPVSPVGVVDGNNGATSSNGPSTTSATIDSITSPLRLPPGENPNTDLSQPVNNRVADVLPTADYSSKRNPIVGPSFGQVLDQAIRTQSSGTNQNQTNDRVKAPTAGPLDNSLTSSSLSRLIVSAQLPVGVEASRWDSSLANAVARLGQLPINDNAAPPEIEIRGRVVLRRPLESISRSLNIVSGDGMTAVVEVTQDALSNSQQADGAWAMHGAKVNVQGVAFEMELSAADSSLVHKSLFALSGNSQLDLNSCTFTVRSNSPANRFCIVSYNEQTGDRRNALDDALVIRTSMSVIRGDTDVIGLNFNEEASGNRAEISLSNTLVAVSGSVLELNSPTGEAQGQRFVRLLCDQSTIVTEQPFAVLTYAGNLAPIVGLMRTSQSSIYWSRAGVPHVQINGAPRQSLLGNFNLLLLQGAANRYDANIQDLCQAYQGNERVATFGFTEASTSGWLTERAGESRVRWRETDFPKLPLSQSAPRDFAVSDGMFVPGITPKNLPLGGED